MERPRVPEELLVGYASGALSPALALLMSTHLDAVPQSADLVADLEAAGGALLLDDVPAALGEGALDAVLDRLDDTNISATVQGPRLDAGPLPARLIEEIGLDFGNIPWKLRLPGIAEYELPGFGSERVSLLRAKPGCGIPQHTHSGQEVTLVLTGGLQDGATVLGAGDISVHDERDTHTPKILGNQVCYCLVVLSGPLRFTGMFSRALNYLGE